MYKRARKRSIEIETNLVFNTGKTKFLLISSNQLSARHKLKDEQLQICCNDTELERVTEWKLLVLTIDEDLTLNSHISKILKDSYSHLSILKTLKRYTSQSVRKQLVESLIFSRLDYCNNLFIDLPQYQVRRMIKLQKSCASFVKGKFCSIEDVVSLKWLLVPERIDFTVLKMTFKGLLNERMPSNFQISIKEKKRELRTASETIKLKLTSEPNYESHFIKYATTLYNEVPKPIQEAEKYSAVVPKLKRCLFDKTLARSLANLRKRVVLRVVCGKKNV